MEFKIGFIGTGIMGKPMVRNLVRSGFDVDIFARHPKKVKDLKDDGIKILPTISRLAEKSNVIITMLPDSCDSRQVIIGTGGIIESAVRGTVVIDMSSIDPLVSKEIGQELSKKGIEFLDAPVSGGEKGAIDGSLAIMVGGQKDIFIKVKSIFSVLGKSFTLIGDAGSGNFAKLANQIIVAVNIAAVSEAFILAKKAGLDLSTVYNAIKNGLAASRVLDSKGIAMIEDNYKPGFKIKLHKKDMQNVSNAAGALNVPLPLASQVYKILKSLSNKGYGELDHSAIVKYFEEISGVKIK